MENYAFLNCTSLADITELSTVQTVGTGAFEGCSSLKEAKFLNLENISENLFLNCSQLNVFISAQDIVSFNPSAFDGCNNLQTITFSSSLYTNESGVVYTADQTKLLYYMPGKTDSVFTLKSTLTQVNTKYLSANSNLKEIETDSLTFKAENYYFNIQSLTKQITNVYRKTIDTQKLAKVIYNFTKNNDFYKIKGGIIDGKVMTAEEIITLAKLPSRETLLSMLAGSLLGTISKFAVALEQVRLKKEETQA